MTLQADGVVLAGGCHAKGKCVLRNRYKVPTDVCERMLVDSDFDWPVTWAVAVHVVQRLFANMTLLGCRNELSCS